jgi:ATP-dependent DNA helicase RecQ
MKSPQNLLKSVFGFDEFRPGQGEIVDAVCAGRNVLAIMPTGGGKSLCFQLPAVVGGGLTVVISPLIALMRDQVRAMNELGIEAGALTSGNTDDEIEQVFTALEEERLRLLYIAPERLANPGTLMMLKKLDVRLIAVDEAHCVSQWGHDFRPDYLRLGDLRKQLNVPLAAFTATADADTRVEIVERLFAGDAPEIFLHGFDRPNINLAFQPKDKPRQQILDFANARMGQSGIVYCGTRAKTEVLAQALRAEGHKALHYHAGIDPEMRRIAETRFSREDGLIVVATVAFGMGVDKPDIRWVAHADLPKSIESYYQEIGRAGRDGAPADTLTLYGADDVRLRRAQIDEGLAPPERKEADHGRLNALLGLAEARRCRRRVLLRYFGDEMDSCENCDLCDNPSELFDGTEAVRKALSAILRTDEFFGASHLIDILRGQSTDKVRQRGHDSLPTFGVGANLSKGEWQAVFRQMMGYDLIRPDAARYGALRMTNAARPILKNEASIELRRDTIVSQKTNSSPVARALMAEEDEPLLAALKSKRRELAEAMKAPAYVVFPDRTLIEMATDRPADLDGFAQLAGVGAKKLKKYGKLFLEVINAAPVQELHPARQKLAGKESGEMFDRLQVAQLELTRGADGVDKPMSCSSADLAKLAAGKPGNLADINRILGVAKAERFGARFLEVLQDA